MTQASYQLEGAVNRFPLSSPQQLWYSGDQGDQGGFFSQRFIMTTALRISGRVDVAALRGALDDVVGRHEILRTVVVRDAEPPYQQVHPPLPVSLQVRKLPPATDRTRDVIAEELRNEAGLSPLSPRQVPLLRAELSRFDDLDSVLTLTTHHTACDEWSLQVIIRDLAAYYSARTSGRRPKLPSMLQYREFAALQLAELSSPAAEEAHRYWREKMRGARIFAVPTDRAVPDSHTEPYSAQNFVVDAEVIGPLAALAESLQTSTATALLAAFNVLVHQIGGTTDPAIDTLTTGRNDPRFENSVGPVMNFLVFRTGLSGCTSFRDILARTRDSCDEAYLHEIPIQHIEREAPELMDPNQDTRMTNFILGIHQSPFDEATLQIADGGYEIRKRVLPAPVADWIPHGVAWAMHLLPSGELSNCIQFNLEDLDERTVADWAAGYRRILAAAASDPDREWKTL
jgi:hypothetical protein